MGTATALAKDGSERSAVRAAAKAEGLASPTAARLATARKLTSQVTDASRRLRVRASMARAGIARRNAGRRERAMDQIGAHTK